MASPDSTQLMEDARCIFSCVPDGMQVPILISLFAKIAGVSADPTTLMEDARCIFTCIPPGMQGAILINLSNQIASGSAGPGTGTFSGTGSPEGVITASPGATYLQTDTSSFWSKKTGTGKTGWIELIA